jgi:hypothetical protein
MSGTIIEFRRYRNLRSRGRGVRAPLPHRPDQQARLDQQITRIEALLEELEEINRGATDVAKTRDILAPPPGNPSHVQDESDPQPQIDHRVLERVYCLLGSLK